jgi:hypothetical protein
VFDALARTPLFVICPSQLLRDDSSGRDDDRDGQVRRPTNMKKTDEYEDHVAMCNRSVAVPFCE